MKKISYAIVLQSQLGPRSGALTLQEEDRVISGELCLLGRRSHFSGSVLEGGGDRNGQERKYLISGALRTRTGKEDYDAIFTVCQGRLSGGLVTRHGCWDLTGVQAAASAEKAERTTAAAT